VKLCYKGWGVLLAALLLVGPPACGGGDSGTDDTSVGTEDLGSKDGEGNPEDVFGETVDDQDLPVQELKPEELKPQCSCSGKQCGDDGCGTSCGNCAFGSQCNAAGTCDVLFQCKYQGFTGIDSYAKLNKKTSGFEAIYQELTSDVAPLDALVIEINNIPEGSGVTGPGVYDLAYTNLGKCKTCLYILKDWSNGTYKKIFVPIQGTMNVTSMSADGGQFKAVLDGAVLQEATSDQQTLEVTLFDAGFKWCLNQKELVAEIVITQSQCVPEGTGIMLNENMANFKMTSCETGEQVALHQTCGQIKALWMVAVAGW